mmetsp:Transcript_8108/g.18058  ORF Transcript_8108/g.18058 Transcript_8108/m.18058 type:complete len:273 (+) Transcript_8108:62-880(+)
MAPPDVKTSSILSLDGSVALITGASSGIGAHLAEVLHAAGADVVLCARRADRLHKLAEDLAARRRNTGANNGGAFVVEMDVANPASIPRGFTKAEECAGRVCDVIINCAGVAMPKKVVDTSLQDYENLMAVNQRGAYFVAGEAARRMMKAGVAGSIINVASILGLRQARGQSTYGMSKAAVVQMTKVLALELASSNIRVNALAPGHFVTEMNSEWFKTEQGRKFATSRIPQKRVGEMRDLDAVTLMLASHTASAFITGAVIPIDGGHLLSAL